MLQQHYTLYILLNNLRCQFAKNISGRSMLPTKRESGSVVKSFILALALLVMRSTYISTLGSAIGSAGKRGKVGVAYVGTCLAIIRSFSKCVNWILVITVINITEFDWVKTTDLMSTIFSQGWSHNSVLEMVESKQWTWYLPFSVRFDLTIVFFGNDWI